MESWDGRNYYTFNPAGWIELINISTSEWGLGPLPPGVVAINRTVSSSDEFSADVLYIIQNAAVSTFLSRDVEKVIFGATSGLVILTAVSWIIFQLWWQRQSLLSPRKKSSQSGNKSGQSILTQDTEATAAAELGSIAGGSQNFLKAEEFARQLRNFYYEPVITELELHEKDFAQEEAMPEDVEAVTDIVRRMYALDLRLYAEQNTSVREEDMDKLRFQSDAALADVRRLVNSWVSSSARQGWKSDEVQYLNSILAVLQSVPEKRYGHL